MPTWIADEHVVFVLSDGQRVSGRISVAAPEQVSTNEAKCSVVLDGLEREWDIRGASTLQALLLAIRFLGMRLHDFLSKGGRVVDPDEDQDMPLEAYFGALLRAAPPPADEHE